MRKLYGVGLIKVSWFSQISGKTLLQLFRFCKSEKNIRFWADKSQIVLTNRVGKNFYHFSNLGKVIKVAWVGPGSNKSVLCPSGGQQKHFAHIVYHFEPFRAWKSTLKCRGPGASGL